MKYVIAKHESNNCTRYMCPECGKTLFISDGTAPVELPKTCGHCGSEVYFKEEVKKDDENEW